VRPRHSRSPAAGTCGTISARRSPRPSPPTTGASRPRSPPPSRPQLSRRRRRTITARHQPRDEPGLLRGAPLPRSQPACAPCPARAGAGLLCTHSSRWFTSRAPSRSSESRVWRLPLGMVIR
jgi:hypothetical protein